MERKGQAAMEFLMTYGWAILAAIIAIAVLAYFGVFSPGKYMPNVCTINAPLGCEEYAISNTNVTLVVRNGAGDSVDISSVTLSGCATIQNESGGSVPYIVADGTTIKLIATGCTGLTTGSKFKGDISIAYIKGTGTLTQTSTGSISGKVA